MLLLLLLLLLEVLLEVLLELPKRDCCERTGTGAVPDNSATSPRPDERRMAGLERTHDNREFDRIFP